MKKEQHGKTYTKEYTAWRSMKERCSLPTNPMFKNYGGRGITICDDWKNSFTSFYKDMGPLPFIGAQLDRIDNDGGYSKENCRWTSARNNSRNKRKSVVLEFNGEKKHLKEWSESTGISYNVLIQRLRRDGWTAEQALTTPASPKRNGRNKIHSSRN